MPLRDSVFQITIPLLYIIAGTGFALSRLPRFDERRMTLLRVAFIAAAAGLAWHSTTLLLSIWLPEGLSLSLGNSASFVGMQLGFIAAIGAFEERLRGLAGGLMLLAALAAAGTTTGTGSTEIESGWQLTAHVLISLFAYGLLAVGAIVAVFGLIHEHRLRSAHLSGMNQFFAPLVYTERLLFGITAAGFASLLLGVLSGFLFVENLFAQHLVHKTVLSLIALLLFGILLAGRQFAGWRGRTAVYLYLWGFGVLCLAYFGSRFVLENLLGKHWG